MKRACFQNFDPRELAAQVEPHLLSWHRWLEIQTRLASDELKLRDVLEVGSCLFGNVILGVVFRSSSPF